MKDELKLKLNLSKSLNKNNDLLDISCHTCQISSQEEIGEDELIFSVGRKV